MPRKTKVKPVSVKARLKQDSVKALAEANWEEFRNDLRWSAVKKKAKYHQAYSEHVSAEGLRGPFKKEMEKNARDSMLKTQDSSRGQATINACYGQNVAKFWQFVHEEYKE